MFEELVLLRDAAEELGMRPEALKRAIARRELKALMEGGIFQIHRTDLEAYKFRGPKGMLRNSLTLLAGLFSRNYSAAFSRFA